MMEPSFLFQVTQDDPAGFDLELLGDLQENLNSDSEECGNPYFMAVS
jgi:hypothetical protein